MRTSTYAALVAPLAMLGLTSALHGQTAPTLPDSVLFQPDLNYGSNKAARPLQLDLVTPKKGHGPFPCVLLFHGGAWVTGSRKEWTAPAFRLAEHGYVVAVIGYTLVPDATLKEQLVEGQQLLRWVETNAAKQNIDLDRLAILGSSSGTQLAGLLAVAINRKAVGPQVRGLVLYAPVTDVTALYTSYQKVSGIRGAVALRILNALLEGTPETNADNYARGSLARQVDKQTPPTLVIHDKADTLVPFAQSELLVSKMKEKGVPVRLITPTDLGHIYTETNRQVYDEPTVEFLDRELKPRSVQR